MSDDERERKGGVPGQVFIGQLRCAAVPNPSQQGQYVVGPHILRVFRKYYN